MEICYKLPQIPDLISLGFISVEANDSPKKYSLLNIKELNCSHLNRICYKGFRAFMSSEHCLFKCVVIHIVDSGFWLTLPIDIGLEFPKPH